MAVKDLFCVEGVPSGAARASSRATGRPTRRPAFGTSSAPAPRCSARRTRTSSRWARRTRTPASDRSRTPGTATRVPGGSSRRLGRRGGGGHGAVGDRHGHRRLDPPAGGAVRRRRSQAHLRRRLPLRDDRLRVVARSMRARSRGTWRTPRCCFATWWVAIPATPPRSTTPRSDAPERRAARRAALRRLGPWRGGSRPGRGGRRPGHARHDRGAGRRRRGDRAADAGHGIAAYYVIAPAEASANLARYDGVRYGPSATGDGDLTSHVRADPPRRLRRGGQAPHHARHLRALLRLLRGLLRHGAEGAHEDRRGLPRPPSSSVDFVVTPTSPTVAFKLGRAHRRPARHVPVRLLHGADAAGGHPRGVDPLWPVRGPAGRLPDRRPGVQREPHPRRGARARAAIGFEGVPRT